MKKLILTSGLTLTALLSSTALAHAGPIGMAIAGFIGLSGTIATVAGSAINLALGLGLSYLSQKLIGGSQQASGIGGMSVQPKSGGAVPRSFIIGRAPSKGSLTYAGSWGEVDGTPNAFFSQVFALSDLPIKGLVELWVDGSKVTWDPSATPGTNGIAIPEYRTDGKDHLWVRFYDGTQTTADALLVSKFAGSARAYGPTRIGTGVAYAVVTARIDDKLFNGQPEFTFVLDGISLYDVRADSSAGGSGSQVFGSPETYTKASANQAVQAYNVVRGIRYNGKWVYGGQTVGSYQLPISSWAAAANECDLSVPLLGGGSEPQYRAGGEISFDTEPADVVEELLKSCNGRLAEIGGMYKPHVGAAGPSVFHITDDDILSTDPQQLDPWQGLGEVVNAVTATYSEPAEGWKVKDAPPLYSLALEAEDDGRRQAVGIDYRLVNSGMQAQRLMKLARDEARRFRRHSLPLPPGCYPLEPNVFISWTSTRNRYVNKLFRIDAAQDQANLNLGVNLTEVDAADGGWIPGVDEKPIVSGPTVVVRPPAQPIIDWNVVPITIRGDGDNARAGIRMSWDPNMDDVDGVQFEVRLQVDQTMVLQGETDRVDAGAIEISQSILGRTRYEVKGRYRPASPRDTLWSSWRAVLTDDVAEGMTQQQAYELSLMTGDARGSMQELQRQLDEVIDRIALDGAENVGADYIQRAAIRGDLVAAIQQVTQAYLAGDTAVASQVTAVNVKADRMSAGGFVKFEATAAPAGVTARFQIFLNAGTEGMPNWKEAGMLLDIVGGVSRCMFLVDKFSIGDGTTSVAPFAVIGGVVYMTGVVIRSANSVVQLDLSGDSLIFTEP